VCCGHPCELDGAVVSLPLPSSLLLLASGLKTRPTSKSHPALLVQYPQVVRAVTLLCEEHSPGLLPWTTAEFTLSRPRSFKLTPLFILHISIIMISKHSPDFSAKGGMCVSVGAQVTRGFAYNLLQGCSNKTTLLLRQWYFLVSQNNYKLYSALHSSASLQEEGSFPPAQKHTTIFLFVFSFFKLI